MWRTFVFQVRIWSSRYLFADCNIRESYLAKFQIGIPKIPGSFAAKSPSKRTCLCSVYEKDTEGTSCVQNRVVSVFIKERAAAFWKVVSAFALLGSTAIMWQGDPDRGRELDMYKPGEKIDDFLEISPRNKSMTKRGLIMCYKIEPPAPWTSNHTLWQTMCQITLHNQSCPLHLTPPYTQYLIDADSSSHWRRFHISGRCKCSSTSDRVCD